MSEAFCCQCGAEVELFSARMDITAPPLYIELMCMDCFCDSLNDDYQIDLSDDKRVELFTRIQAEKL